MINTEKEKEKKKERGRTQLVKRIFSGINPIHRTRDMNPDVKRCIKGFYNLIHNSHDEFFCDKGITATLKKTRRELVKDRRPDYFKKHDETADHAVVMPEWVNSVLKGGTHLTCNLSFNVSGRVVNLSVLIPNKSAADITVKDYDAIHAVVQYVYAWMTAAYNFATAECSNVLNIYIYLTDICKTANPASTSTSNTTATSPQLTTDNVNTAFTWSCKRENTICVYRKEEWFKCFIHETFHNLDLDFSLKRDNAAVLNCLKSTLNISKDELNIYETYCEVWAVFISVLFSACNYVDDSKSRINDAKLFAFVLNALEMETRWSLLQMTKILDMFNIGYADLISADPAVQNKVRRIKIDSDDTNVFSYYIAKSVCMVSPWDFIQWCITHNTAILNFNNDDENVLRFCDFLKELFNDKRIPIITDKIRNMLLSIDDANANTMRMTIFDVV